MTTSPSTTASVAPDVHEHAENSRPQWQRPALAAATVAWVVGAAVLLAIPPVPMHRIALLQTAVLFACGVIIVRRTTTPVIGWLLIGAGTTFNALYVSGTGLTVADPSGWTRFLVPLSTVGVTCLFLLLLTFPTGRFDTRLVRVAGIGFVVVQLFGFVYEYLALFEVVRDPAESLVVVGFAVSMLVLVAGLVDHARRYRGRPRTEQLQLKWFLLAIVAQFAYAVVLLLGVEPGSVAFFVIDNVATSLIPIAILIAITRYRLYEIDRIISRTVAYALVIATLAALGIGGVTVITSLLPTQDSLAVALSTIAVVALFDPLRRRVVDAVDRRFDRTRYVARQVVEGFGRDVQDVTDLDEIGARVHTVIGHTVAPTTVAVWQPRTDAP